MYPRRRVAELLAATGFFRASSFVLHRGRKETKLLITSHVTLDRQSGVRLSLNILYKILGIRSSTSSPIFLCVPRESLKLYDRVRFPSKRKPARTEDLPSVLNAVVLRRRVGDLEF